MPGCRSSGTGQSHLALMPLGFWFLGISLPFVSCAVWLLAGEALVRFGFVGLVWAHRHLVQTARANRELLTLRFHAPSGKPLRKKKLVGSRAGQSIAMIQWQEKWPKNIRSLLIGKWTKVPLCQVFQQPGADQTKTPTSPEGQSLLGKICPCFQGQVEHFLV